MQLTPAALGPNFATAFPAARTGPLSVLRRNGASALQSGAQPRRQSPRSLAPCALSSPSPAGAALESSPEIAASYILGPQVGRGSFAVVYEVTDMRSGVRLAAKKLPKYVHGRLPSQQAAVVGAEAATQRALAADSPSVLPLVDLRQCTDFWYLVSELCLTDLGSYLKQRGGAPLPERMAAHILRHLLSALAACHRAGIAFRDVKPANLLVRSIDANGMPEIALADFGCCRSTAGSQSSDRSSAGTPLYSAPECVHHRGDCSSDVWAAGIMLFYLLSGCYPFCDPRHKISQGEYWRRVQEAPIHTAGPAWQAVSPDAVALVRRMLDRDCSSRITAEQALQDPWLLEMTSSPDSSWQHGIGCSKTPQEVQRQEPRVSSNVVPGLPVGAPAQAAAA